MMEMSIKAPAPQAACAAGGFMAFLAEIGAERDNEQQTKTRWAMSYYARKLDKGARKARSAPPKPREVASQRRRSATKKVAKPVAGSASKNAPRRGIRKAAPKGR